MKYLLLFFVLILIYVAYSYGFIWYKQRTSTNPLIVQQQREVGAGPILRYIAAGDSSAVGIGSSSVEHSYPYLVADKLSENNRVLYENIAVSGARTNNVIDSQLEKIIDYNPDIVTISIGGNDQTHLRADQLIIDNYKFIIAELTGKTHAKIYITNVPNFTGATILPTFYIKLLEYKSNKLNQRLNQLNTDRVKIINIHDFGLDKFPDRGVIYSSDNFHPNDIGYANWADAFLDKIINR